MSDKKSADADASAVLPAQTSATPKLSPDAAPAPGPVMYVGKSRPFGLPLTFGTVFRGGVPSMFRARMDENSSFGALFVPVAECGAALKSLKDPASPLAKAAKAVPYAVGTDAARDGGAPRRASAAGTTLPASESERPAGRGAERHPERSKP